MSLKVGYHTVGIFMALKLCSSPVIICLLIFFLKKMTSNMILIHKQNRVNNMSSTKIKLIQMDWVRDQIY